MVEEEMGSKYFESLYNQLSSIEEDAPWANQVMGQLHLHKMDVRFLKVFCLCFETWDFATDEESRGTLRSTITPLNVIWAKEDASQSISSRLFEIRKKGVRYFYPVAFDLEGKIQQTMLQIEGCENSVYCSMQCKSSTIDEMLRFLGDLLQNLNDLLNYRAVKIVPFKKQIDTLKDKLVFLCNSLKKIAICRGSSQEFVNFVGVFANKAACLTCLYWAKKEANEQVAAETNLLLLDMIHQIKPCAPVVTACYLAILDSNNLLPSDSRSLGETVPGFVDLFFEHQETSLKDDFLILRDRLIFLFTFLTYPPSDNAKDAGDLIRSQIHALFREDEYLLLTFDEMKEDLSDKKMLLSNFMDKIEMVNAKIIQLYHGFSASFFVLEEEKLNYMFFVPVQRELSLIEKHAHWADDLVVCQLQLYRMELRFLWMFLQSFSTRDDIDEGISVNLSSLITSLEGIWGKEEEEKGLLAARLHVIRRGDITDWHQLAFELEVKIQLSKLEIEVWWANLFHWSFRCKPSTSNEILMFLDSIMDNLKDLVSYKAGKIVPFIKQIESLEEKLLLLQNLLKLTANCINNKELREFNMFVQVFANNAACLTFLYWAKEANDETATEISIMLSDMLQMIKPDTPVVAGLYFETLKVIYLQHSDSLLFGQTVSIFVDFFLEDLVIPLKDEFQILRHEMIFLLTFLNDPPNGNADELICSKADALFSDCVFGILPFDDMKRGLPEKMVIISDFMMKIKIVNDMIRQHYCNLPNSSLYSFPKITALRFLDFLIQNIRSLKERMISELKWISFTKYKIIKLEEELVSLRLFFFELKRERNDLKFFWLEVGKLVHLTEHVINSFISSCFVSDQPIWYHMAHLSKVIDSITFVKLKLSVKYHSDHAYDFSASYASVADFDDKAKKIIIDKLISGHLSLDIISIVGMAGLGKTFLAQEVYCSNIVQTYFKMSAFCCVSQNHNKRRLLLDILTNITEDDGDKISAMTDGDLVFHLWKCLRNQRYLIVLDDIWSISAWNEVKRSFPDDKNGSRVMFTTRSLEVAKKAKIKSSPHHLRFLTHVQSWKLLQKKVFQNDIPPPYLIEIGKLIAENCKGLPFAVHVIAGVLSRTERSLSRWTEIAERVDSYVSDEGFVDKLESSYQPLPEYLKPCFLYLGAFPKDRLIRVKKMMLLWIAEGFIQDSKTKSKEDAAKEYFHDLVDRSLIIISTRSSKGKVKSFRVNDQVHDFCQRKCRDGNFFQLRHGITASGSSYSSIYNHYRVSMKEQNGITVDAEPSLGSTRSLLYFGKRGGLFDSIPLSKFKLAQVLHLETIWWKEDDLEPLSSLVHLRHIEAITATDISIPSSICNLWNMESLILRHIQHSGQIYLPDTLWMLKRLRYVKVEKCKLKFPVGHEHDTFPRLDEVVVFSNPILSTGKDVERLLQRLPAVRKLSCHLDKSLGSVEERVETFEFCRELLSLKLNYLGKRSPYLIKFPVTLQKLTLERFQLSWTVISAIAQLQGLRVLKLRWNSFPGPSLDMKDLEFSNLRFFELRDSDIVQWNASADSFPSLEQLLIECRQLRELPLCLEEIEALKRIEVKDSPEVKSSVRQIQKEQMELGKEVEVLITSSLFQE